MSRFPFKKLRPKELAASLPSLRCPSPSRFLSRPEGILSRKTPAQEQFWAVYGSLFSRFAFSALYHPTRTETIIPLSSTMPP